MPTIQLKRDILVNWVTTNPILAVGEIGVEIDSTPIKFKIGNGTSQWSTLPYFIQETTIDSKISTAITNLINGASSGYDTLKELETLITGLAANKVDKVDGEGLSTNDFSDSYKNNLIQNTIARHTHANLAELDNFKNDINTVYIYEKSDFPDPVAGVVTLAENKRYLIHGSIPFGTDKIVLNNNSMLIGTNPLISGLHYTGSESFINSANKTIAIQNLHLSATAGTIINATGDLTNNFYLETCILDNALKLASITGFHLVYINKLLAKNFNSGISFYGTSIRLKIANMHIETYRFSGTGDVYAIEQAANSIIQLGGVVSSSSFNLINSGDKVLYIDPTADVGSGLVEGNVVIGTTGYSAIGPTPYPPQLIVRNNNGISDFTSNAIIGFTGNTSETIISAANTWTKIVGTTTPKILSRFESSVSGRLTFTGIAEENFAITAFIDAEKLTSGTVLIQFAFFKNGSRITDIIKEVSYDGAGQTKSITIGTMEGLTTNDYIEVYTQNITNNDDVLIKNLQLRISR